MALVQQQTDIEQYLAAHRCPYRLWVGPAAWSNHHAGLLELLTHDADVQPVPLLSGATLPGPAVMLLAPADLHGEHRRALLALAATARPGRPVIFGGTDNRDTLLDAINTWHAIRIVPSTLPLAAAIDATRQAHEALTMENAVECCIAELHQECRRRESAVAELTATHSRLMHEQQMVAIGEMTHTLMERVQAHFHAMERFTDALAPLSTTPGISAALAHAIEGTRSVEAMLKDLIALTEDRHEDIVLNDEHLDQLVDRSVALFRLDPIAREHDIEVHCSSDATVRVDRYRLYHVLMNLLRNAVQATKPRSTIAVRTASTNNRCAVIEVHDSGPGIPPEVKNQIFQPFFTTKGSAGTGLGLRMSKTAVERQGGGLECITTPGEGTCFRIRLPLASGPHCVGVNLEGASARDARPTV